MDMSELNTLYQIKERVGKELISNNENTKTNDDVEINNDVNHKEELRNKSNKIINIEGKSTKKYTYADVVSNCVR